ncbi:MAG: anaerobic ribonucleoside-triphosphate reductase activating protein [Methanomassiliicoccaceae archaeon]|nr:anaerobic ribonucleoside-triphosphate reductase activating protein [Methanomassiliicoccaceae archaeon]
MKIGGFIKTTLSDWDGKVSCLVFLAGCNFSCPYCHNPEIAKGTCEHVDVDEVIRYIAENSDFLEGVVISGGEPTLNGDLYQFLKEIKKMGLGIKIDTNGSSPEVLDDIIGAKLVDYVAMDIKAPLAIDKYRQATGGYGDVDAIKRSICLIMDSGVGYEFRTTVYPGVLSHEDVVDIARSVKGAERFCIQQFRPKITLDPEAGKVKPYSVKELRAMHDAAKPYVKRVSVRGL